MARGRARYRNAKHLESSVSSTERTETEDMANYNGDVSSYEDSLNSDQSRAISEMYASFDVKDITKEEFASMLAYAPRPELESMIESQQAEPRIRHRPTAALSASAESSGSEGSSSSRLSEESEASEELDPELSVSLSRIGQFTRDHPFNKDPLVVHTVSERRAYTRAVYDYARALGLSSLHADEVVKEVRRTYRKSRHVARILSWVDLAAQAGRTMEDELERIRSENGWDTDELEGNFKDEEELETNFGTEIDDTVEAPREPLAPDDAVDEEPGGMPHLAPSDVQVDQPSSEAEMPTTMVKPLRQREKKRRRRDSAPDDDEARRYKKTVKHNKCSDVDAEDVEKSKQKPTALHSTVSVAEGDADIVELTKSDHIPEQQPPIKLTKSQRKKRNMRENRLLEGNHDQGHTKPGGGRSPAVGGGKGSVQNQGFVVPNDTPNTTGVEGVVRDSGDRGKVHSRAGRRGSGRDRGDGMLTSVTEAESDAEYESVASSFKASDNLRVAITHSSPPSSTTSEDDTGRHGTGGAGHTDLVMHQIISGSNTPDVSKSPSTPRKARKRVAPLTSPYFKKSKVKSRRSLQHPASCIPFPSISRATFGLIQEKLAHEPFKLLVAVTFLNRTRGIHAIPVFYSLMDRYPTPDDLAAANEREVASQIRHLGLQNTRARRYIQLARAWVEDPPVMGRRHRKLHYPNVGDGKELKRGEIIDDEDERTGAWEVAHLPTTGPYAIDSWRIFCRDQLRGKITGAKDQITDEVGFEPEWKKVVPLDKELRGYLRWRWLKEGWDWDPRTGKKIRASQELLERAERGELLTEGAVDAESAGDEPIRSVDMLTEEVV